MVRWKMVAVLTFLLFLVSLALAGTYYTNRILPGVTVYNHSLSGLEVNEAREVLSRLSREIEDRQFSLRLGKNMISTTFKDLGLTIDYEKTLDKAYAVGRKGDILERLHQFFSGTHELNFSWNLQQEKLKKELQKLGRVYKKPINAQMELDSEGKPHIKPGQDGWQVDTNTLISNLKNDINVKIIDVPLNRIKPKITTEEIKARKITKLTGKYTTFFNSANKNRTHNIRLAASALDGIWLKPGEVLSFNERVGPRSLETGYREAIVIENQRFVSGVGGGVCQLASTFYNAALIAGLTIVERQPHGLAISYVPLGRDATVAYGLIDLKIRNDNPYWYWIKTSIENNKLTVSFYSSEEAPYAEVISRIIEKVPPPEKIVWKPDWDPERVEIKSRGQNGYRTEVVRIIHKNNEEYKEFVSKDFYPPIPSTIFRGRKSNI
ncbi:MAG: hypothetical protein PWP31_99 [Clostridia bacterium]|nr:hypothetical protein [Clostridia bacterium]